MNKLYRLTVIAESRKKPEIVHVQYWDDLDYPHLTKSMLQECINIVYSCASLDDRSVIAYLDIVDAHRYTKIAEIKAFTACTIWPDRIANTSIYLNNKYIRTMGGRGE